jgi:hypothetical protein
MCLMLCFVIRHVSWHVLGMFAAELEIQTFIGGGDVPQGTQLRTFNKVRHTNFHATRSSALHGSGSETRSDVVIDV